MTLSESCIELQRLGFGGSVPDTIDGQALHEMSLMAGYYSDAEEYVDPEIVARVAAFVESMLPEARRVSEEIGLQSGMFAARVESARADALKWRQKLDEFDKGNVVNYEYADGTPIRPIESREALLGIIAEFDKVVAAGGKWW